MSDRNEIVSRVTAALEGKPAPVAIRNARKVDARGERRGYWVVSDAAGVIVAAGTGEETFEHYCRTVGLDPADRNAVIDAEGRILTPGYMDIHAHGAWEKSFDDGPDGIDVARAGHAVHGTTRQVLSLITNPVDVICRNIRTVRATMESGRPDILGCHLEGPFLALARKGAHDPECLKDPVPDIVDKMLEASGADPPPASLAASARSPSAPNSPHGILRHPPVRRCRRGAGRGPLRRRLRDRQSRLRRGRGHHDPHVQRDERPASPRTRSDSGRGGGPARHHRAHQRRIPRAGSDGEPLLPVRASPHGLVTDAMAATDCPDGAYKLGALDVNVVGGHARLVSNGAIAGSTLLLEVAVRRAVCELGFSPVDAVEAATLTPAKAFGFDRPNPVTGAPIGLIAPGFAADFNLADPADWTVEQVWCAGRKLK